MIVPMKTSEKIRKFLVELVTEEEQNPAPLRFGKKIRSFFIRLMAYVVIMTFVMLLYINVGHERGWPRAERWYHALYDVKH